MSLRRWICLDFLCGYTTTLAKGGKERKDRARHGTVRDTRRAYGGASVVDDWEGFTESV